MSIEAISLVWDLRPQLLLIIEIFQYIGIFGSALSYVRTVVNTCLN